MASSRQWQRYKLAARQATDGRQSLALLALENTQLMKILVTGADGLIGSHLGEALVDRGEKVRAFVRYNAFSSWGWLDTVGDYFLSYQFMKIFFISYYLYKSIFRPSIFQFL
jgi:hypothetical protein